MAASIFYHTQALKTIADSYRFLGYYNLTDRL